MKAARKKPLCNQCGEYHWNIIRCVEVPAENDREQRRDGKHTAARVTPVVRTHTATPRFQSQNFVQQAPGVYRRRER